MAKLPVVSGKQARRAFERAGWQFDRQRGSHVVLIKSDERLSLSVPMHRELRPGLLLSLIRDADLTTDQFVELLKGK